MKISEFNNLLPSLCSSETSSHPKLWTKENLTYGHYAIVSVLAQDYFGGEIVKVSLKNTPYENLKSHFFNIIDGKEIDFTKQQFDKNFSYQTIPREKQSRKEILSHPGTQERYDVLKEKLSR